MFSDGKFHGLRHQMKHLDLPVRSRTLAETFIMKNVYPAKNINS